MEWLFSIVVLISCTQLVHAERHAPVLVWESTETRNELPAFPAAPAVSNTQLKSMLDNLDTQVLVMFIMNELNVEDFSGYPDALSELRSEFESSDHAFTPSMSDPAQVPALLSAYKRVTVDVDSLAALKLPDGAKKTLLLVYLNDRSSGDRAAELRQSDGIISKVLARVRSLTSRYAAVLTGKHTTMGSEESRRVARSLKAIGDEAADDGMDYFYNLGCIYLFTSSAPVVRFRGANGADDQPTTVAFSLNATTVDGDPQTMCNNDTGAVWSMMTWKNVPDDAGSGDKLDRISINYTFVGRRSAPDADTISSWTLTGQLSFSGTVQGAALSGDLMLDFDDIYAPIGFSYHCTDRLWTFKNSTVTGNAQATPATISSVELEGFQVQAFAGESDSPFGRPWDCTPFFTIPIWSGLFLSLILLAILTWALQMLASVPTMDRFDDPRGQPLQVPTAE